MTVSAAVESDHIMDSWGGGENSWGCALWAGEVGHADLWPL